MAPPEDGSLRPIRLPTTGRPDIYQQLVLFFNQQSTSPERTDDHALATFYQHLVTVEGAQTWLEAALSPVIAGSKGWKGFDANRRSESSFDMQAAARMSTTAFLAYWTAEINVPTLSKKIAIQGQNASFGVGAGVMSSGQLFFDKWAYLYGEHDVEAVLVESGPGTTEVNVTIFKKNEAVALFKGRSDTKLVGMGSGYGQWN